MLNALTTSCFMLECCSLPNKDRSAVETDCTSLISFLTLSLTRSVRAPDTSRSVINDMKLCTLRNKSPCVSSQHSEHLPTKSLCRTRTSRLSCLNVSKQPTMVHLQRHNASLVCSSSSSGESSTSSSVELTEEQRLKDAETRWIGQVRAGRVRSAHMCTYAGCSHMQMHICYHTLCLASLEIDAMLVYSSSIMDAMMPVAYRMMTIVSMQTSSIRSCIPT